jgi:hypothetical protein
VGGTYTVKFTVTDDDGGIGTATQKVLVGGVGLIHDPCDETGNPNLTILVVTGTEGNDVIRIKAGAKAGDLVAIVNGVNFGTFHPTDGFVVYGLGGDDDIRIAGAVKAPAVVFGGFGDDYIEAGGGPSALVGGDGHDHIHGAGGRDLIIGGRGCDDLSGYGNDDILISEYTDYDDNLCALECIRDEWARTDVSYLDRVGHLLGSKSGGTNGAIRLNWATVHDDRSGEDYVSGDGGRDWFLAPFCDSNPPDYLVDVACNEIVTNVNLTAPTIVSQSPAISATKVAVSAAVRVVFSQEMDLSTLTLQTFVLRDAKGNVVACTISYDADAKGVTLKPTAPLTASAKYTVSILGAKDAAGLALSSTTWAFTTHI